MHGARQKMRELVPTDRDFFFYLYLVAFARAFFRWRFRNVGATAASFAAFAFLGYSDAPWGRQQNIGDEPLLLQPEHGVTNFLDLGTGIMHQDQSVRRNLRQEVSEFLFS